METWPETATDENLARAARDGSDRAFEALVTRYEKRVFHFFRHRTHNDADSKDLTQQLFVNVYRGLARFDSNRKLAPWLFTIAVRCFVNHYRARAAERRPPIVAEEPVDACTPDTILGGQEAEDNLWDWARSQLTPAQFDVLWLRIQEDLAIKDIARATRHSSANVKVMLHRARRRLRRAWSTPNPHAMARDHRVSCKTTVTPLAWPVAVQREGNAL